MPSRSHYEVLGVERTADADRIHEGYLERLNEVHPDRNQGDEDTAHERTIEVVAAYRVLSDPESRKRYDFRMQNPFCLDGELPGFGVLKRRNRKEAEERFREGAYFLRADDLVKAVEPFKAALRLEPDYPPAAYNLALVGALLGSGTFALDVLAKALVHDPKEPSLLRLRQAVLETFLAV